MTATTALKAHATVVDLNNKKGWFAVDSLSWGAMRGVSVDIGNANNQDNGMVALGEISISKSYDGATPYLLTYLFQPGAEGKTVELVMTKHHVTAKVLYRILLFHLKKRVCLISIYQVVTVVNQQIVCP